MRKNPVEHLPRLWRRLLIVAASCVLCCPAPAPYAMAGPPDTVRELSIKAAFVLNIARFVQWPEAASAGSAERLWLCTLQDDVFKDAGEGIRGRNVGGRELGLRVVATVREATDCNILYIPGERLAAYLAATSNQPIPRVLTVTDLTNEEYPGDDQSQPIVALFRDHARIRFSIDIGLSKRSGLRLSSELLKLGRIVGDQEEMP